MRAFRRGCIIFALSAAPALALAQSAPQNFSGLANLIVQIITAATALVIGLGVLYYTWGIVKALTEVGSAKGREILKKQVPWGIFAIFLIFFVWAIIRVLQNTLFGSNNFSSFGS